SEAASEHSARALHDALPILFGYNGWGWRFTAAIAGTIIILLVIRIARRLTRSTLLGAVAGILVICDGVLHLQSRMGMLDIFQARSEEHTSELQSRENLVCRL